MIRNNKCLELGLLEHHRSQKEVECPSTGRLKALYVMALSMTDEQQALFEDENSCFQGND
jgi:hypothetical protein